MSLLTNVILIVSEWALWKELWVTIYALFQQLYLRTGPAILRGHAEHSNTSNAGNNKLGRTIYATKKDSCEISWNSLSNLSFSWVTSLIAPLPLFNRAHGYTAARQFCQSEARLKDNPKMIIMPKLRGLRTCYTVHTLSETGKVGKPKRSSEVTEELRPI